MTSETLVRDQYESFPYPPRRPSDERTRLITGAPSQVAELDHYVFGGRRDVSKPFRALVAGGGTGDATIMLAQQLADRGNPSEVVYLDVSTASRGVAEERARVRGLGNIRFETGSLLDLASGDFGPFDYIDCCGVLHHLETPAAGLRALTAVLAEDGGMGLMLYGELGRSGVYAMQDMLRMVAPADTTPARDRLELTRRLLQSLPPGNLLRRNPFISDHLQDDDAHIFDLFLHARDRAYRVSEIAELTAGAGLRIIAFIPPALYDPATIISDPRLAARLTRLDPIERAAFAELLAGSVRKHIFYAVKADNPVAPPDPQDPAAVPVLLDVDGAAVADQFQSASSLSATLEGLSYRRPMPALTAPLMRRIDGRRPLADLHADITAAGTPVGWPTFADQFAQLFETMNGLGKMVLTLSPAPAA